MTTMQRSEAAMLATSSRASKRRCVLSIESTGTWFDVAATYVHAAINPTRPGGPGGTS